MYTNKCGRGNKQDVSVYHIFKQQDFYKKLCRDASSIIPTYLSLVGAKFPRISPAKNSFE